MAEEILVEDDPLLMNPEANWGQQPIAEALPPQIAPVQFPPPPVQPSPTPVNPRDQYIAMQLRLADMIRQRNEEQGGPGALQQPSEEELALKSDLAQIGRQQQEQQPAIQPTPFRRPPSQVDFAEQNLRQAEEQKNRAVRNALSQIRVKNVAEAQKALAYYKQEQAGNRWKTIYGTQIAHGVAPDEAARVAWRDVSPLVFQGYGPAGLNATTRAGARPPGLPQVMQVPGGGAALVDARGTPHFVPKAAPQAPSQVKAPRPSLAQLKVELTSIQSKLKGPDRFLMSDEESNALKGREAEILTEMQSANQGKAATTETTTAQSPKVSTGQPNVKGKVSLANKLRTDHPDWSREQIIKEVNRQLP